MDSTLFLMDMEILDTFYHGIFKFWDCFKRRTEGYRSPGCMSRGPGCESGTTMSACCRPAPARPKVHLNIRGTSTADGLMNLFSAVHSFKP